MKCGELVQLLNHLATGHLNGDVPNLDYLAEHSLVRVMDTQTYASHAEKAKSYAALENSWHEQHLKLEAAARAKDKFLETHWKKLEAPKYKSELHALEHTVSEERIKLELVHAERTPAEEAHKVIAGYGLIGGTYVKVLEFGKERMGQLANRLDRLRSVEYDDAAEEFRQLAKAVDRRVFRYHEIYQQLEQKRMGGAPLARLATRIAVASGASAPLVEKVWQLDLRIDKGGLGYDATPSRYRILARVFDETSSIDRLSHALQQAYSTVTRYTQQEGIQMVRAASFLMQDSTDEQLTERLFRFPDLYQQLISPLHLNSPIAAAILAGGNRKHFPMAAFGDALRQMGYDPISRSLEGISEAVVINAAMLARDARYETIIERWQDAFARVRNSPPHPSNYRTATALTFRPESLDEAQELLGKLRKHLTADRCLVNAGMEKEQLLAIAADLLVNAPSATAVPDAPVVTVQPENTIKYATINEQSAQ
jgi:hypothetical protein